MTGQGKQKGRKGNKGAGRQGIPRSFGTLSRVIVQGLVWEIVEDGTPSIRLEADLASVDPPSHKVRLLQVRLGDLLTDRVIVAHKMVWDGDKQQFEIPGAFVAVDGEQRVAGQGIRVDPRFVVQPLTVRPDP